MNFKSSFNSGRFGLLSFVVTAAILIITFVFVFCVDDSRNHVHTFFERIVVVIWAVAAWPVLIAAFILHGDPPALIGLPLIIFSGLFWAAVIELLVMVSRRSRSNEPIQPTPR